MDCKHMIEINDKGLFQDMLRYHEVTKEMIEGCLDDEIDNSYEGWSLTKDLVYPASRCLKLLNPRLYSELVINYMKRNNIIPLDCEEGVRYFEFEENKMTYDEFKNKMRDLCEDRRKAWHEADWDADLKIEKSMDELEKTFPEFYDRWYNELLEAFKSDYGIKL